MAAPSNKVASPPPSYSRLSHGEIAPVVNALRSASLQDSEASASSTATTLPGYSAGRSQSTSSGTRERLQLLEKQLKDERDVVSRLKLEGQISRLSNMEKDSRLQKLKADVVAAKAEAGKRATDGIFKASCATDLLFLIDTTASMTGHIKAAKEQVKSIVKEIEETFFKEAEVRIAVVGYKDHSDHPNIQFLDFTPSSHRVRSFIDALNATGGYDIPEDVLGGIQQALNASWRNPTRCIIHIADAPPHGRNIHDLSKDSTTDHYLDPGSEPHGLTYEPLIKQMAGLQINYALLRINESTNLMAFNFSKIYSDNFAECKLHKNNTYYYESEMYYVENRVSAKSSGRTTLGSLIFEENQLGVKFSDLHHLVVKMVTTSVSRTAVRLSGSSSGGGGRKRGGSKLDSGLGAISEDGAATTGTILEKIPPQWSIRGWFNETLVVEGFSPDVVVHDALTLDSMMGHDDNIKMSVTELTIQKRSRPFAQGANRLAFYARTLSSNDRFVVKSFKKGGKGLPHLAEDMRAQALCKAFALDFNAYSCEKEPIDFIVTTCLKGKQGGSTEEECLSLEPFIHGEYVKYNNNCGYVNNEIPDDNFNQAAQAFSHFTFERSKGRFLISDLQGVGNLLTDPAIHTSDPERFKLAETNLGDAGFKFFFSTHKCNHICTKLGLKSNAHMIKTGRFSFRNTWPKIDTTVCCSNKLCGKIVHLASAKKSEEFPGYHWCDKCWPQLESSKTKRICIAEGPHHEFDVSAFFYESQGQRTLRMCSMHNFQSVLESYELNGEESPTPPGGPASMRRPESMSGSRTRNFMMRRSGEARSGRRSHSLSLSRNSITEEEAAGPSNAQETVVPEASVNSSAIASSMPSAAASGVVARPVVLDDKGKFWNKLKHATSRTFARRRASSLSLAPEMRSTRLSPL